MGHNHRHHLAEVDPEVPEPQARYRQAKKATLVGAAINLCLALGKISFGSVGQSQALVADGIHSLSDLVTDAFVLVATKQSSRDADDQHPYGHRRIETAVTVGLGIFLIAVAVGIAFDAIRRVIEPNFLLHPHQITLVVAALSVVANEFLYFYTLNVAKLIRSNLLRANAWHHRTDSISSVIVIIGIGGTLAGINYLDAVAAVGVAVMIAKVGWDISIQSFRELIDTALEPEQIAAIREIIQSVDGVQQLHMLRTRRTGSDALVDVHIQVDPKLSVSEGHYISEKVRLELIRQLPDVNDVMVHIDSEDDETSSPSTDLPSRKALTIELKKHWGAINETQYIDKITLHYLNGKIHVEILLPLGKFEHQPQATQVADAISRAAREVEHVASAQVFFTNALK